MFCGFGGFTELVGIFKDYFNEVWQSCFFAVLCSDVAQQSVVRISLRIQTLLEISAVFLIFR